jgi:hypothetical protein
MVSVYWGVFDGTQGRALHYSSERGAWSVAIHPGGIESAAKLVYGTREYAEREAHSMIDRWPQRRSRTPYKLKPGAGLK